MNPSPYCTLKFKYLTKPWISLALTSKKILHSFLYSPNQTLYWIDLESVGTQTVKLRDRLKPKRPPFLVLRLNSRAQNHPLNTQKTPERKGWS